MVKSKRSVLIYLLSRSYGLLDDEELEEYVDKFEVLLGRRLDPGRGSAVPLRLTIDKVRMLHKPLLWYLVSSYFSKESVEGKKC